METIKTDRLGFAGFVLDRGTGRLLGQDGEIRLRPQALRLLEVLVEAAPRILSQDELLDQAWGVEHLSPASVKQAVSEIRQALGDDPAKPSIIETVHRRGYRLIAPVKPVVRTPDLSTRPIASVPRGEPEEALEEMKTTEIVAAGQAPSPRTVRRMGAILAILAFATLSLGVASRSSRPPAARPRPGRPTRTASPPCAPSATAAARPRRSTTSRPCWARRGTTPAPRRSWSARWRSSARSAISRARP